MTDGPFRATDSDLDADARAMDAITRLGAWRSRLEARVLLGFLLVWLAWCPVGWVLVQNYQFENHGRANLLVNVAVGCILPLIAFVFVGGRVARAVARRRMPAEITRLAQIHRVPEDEIARFAVDPR